MTANEIRNMSIHHFPKAIFLQEIAAQPAELNEGIRQLVPAPKTDVPEPYEPSEQDRHEDALTAEEDRKREQALATLHEEAMARPTSDSGETRSVYLVHQRNGAPQAWSSSHLRRLHSFLIYLLPLTTKGDTRCTDKEKHEQPDN